MQDCHLGDYSGHYDHYDHQYRHDDDDYVDDIYIMMQFCLSRKMITSSWESPVTTCNHP